ncbi:hypothetical protein K469DRAFT_547858 [Zopfia rhizophila CBS 207.26]|uniref:Alpha/beta-hydrolase n=1 Tax=Zopfia rhizophila CBS 207.26 TaxID=1314779 RepID=A0A6A6ERL6_9PEZI|nr:hypothetical protein K469DRAFT_547858 [Zopfia rhizophila CBS 207.26]
MAESIPEAADEHLARQNALSEIQIASIVDPDLTPSEDETPEEKALQLEDAQSAIGVSIGQAQTRLTSPKTPAAEKAAALDDVEGGGLFEGWQQSVDGTIEERAQQQGPSGEQNDGAESQNKVTSASPAQDERPVRLPSPWRASPKRFQRVDEHRTALRDSFTTGNRRRALSGGLTTEALRKYWQSFNLPSMPKTPNLLNFSLPSFSVPYGLDHSNIRARTAAEVGQRKRITSDNVPITQNDGPRYSKGEGGRSPLSRCESRKRQPFPGPDPNTDPEAPTPGIQRQPTPKLRRSNSEGSLVLYRSLSFASSLGDDSRFEHVQEQVNSRLKAIKDSWQDANFKLPGIPTLPNFSFGSRDDLFRLKNGSATPRGFSTEPANRSSSLANSNGVARGVPTRVPRLKDSAGSIAGMTAANAMAHPYFTRAVQDLTGDLVILGGYRGSILRSAEPPNRQLWVPLKVGLNLRKVDLELGLNVEDEETEEDRIIPAGMLTHIGPVDIAKRLFKRLRASENAKKGTLRIHNYGYDWRLSPHILSRRLIKYLKTLPCNQPGTKPEKRGAIILAHSLGGLITRHVINQCPELVSGVIYAGVPQTCVNILGPLRNGDDVLLSSRVLTAQVNFTIRTSYALLPLDGKCFFNKHTKEEYPVDFFDINTWIEHRLSPCIATPLPPLNTLPNSSMSGILNAMSNALPSLPILGRKGSVSKGSNANGNTPNSKNLAEGSAHTTGFTPQMGNKAHPHPAEPSLSSSTNSLANITIPRDKAIAYLTRTLSEIKKFKQELAFKPEHSKSNSYPPIALIYGKSTPTVYGAKVESRDAIKRADVYDELAFASGDGVVLARAAMVPEGYSVVRGGVVSSDRGHVTLLGDIEAVGRCLSAIVGARKNGVGLGVGDKGKTEAKE